MGYSVSFYMQDPTQTGTGLVYIRVHKHLDDKYAGMADVLNLSMVTPGAVDEQNPIPWLLACFGTAVRLLHDRLVADQEVGAEKLTLNFQVHKEE